jgi:hypothetical protein
MPDKKNTKVRDLNPKKEAKGGVGRNAGLRPMNGSGRGG